MKLHKHLLPVLLVLACLVGSGLPAHAATPTPPPGLPDNTLSALNELHRTYSQGLLPPIAPGSAAPTQAPTAPEGIGDWSAITYQSFVTDNYEVFRMNGNGGATTRLTNHPANDGRPRFNRGATEILFSSNRDGDFEIFKMNADGSNLRQLTFNNASDAKPAWSFDGKKIAFMSDLTGKYEIYIMNADGSGLYQLTNDPNAEMIDPVWSPDGTKIAYVRMTGDGMGLLYTSFLDGIRFGAISSIPYLFMENLAWSPDGKYIAFDGADNGDPFTKLHIYAADNGFPAAAPYISKQDQYEDHLLGGWSPDNQRLIYTRVQYEVVDNKLYIKAGYIETIRVEYDYVDHSPTRLTTSGLDFLPDWQGTDPWPPNTRINLPAYSRSNVFTLRWDGSEQGSAPVKMYNIQWKNGLAANWVDAFFSPTNRNSAQFGKNTPGSTYYFRASAVDEAGNQEAYPAGPAGDASTSLYTWQISGKATDNRGIPLLKLPVTLSSPALKQPATGAGGAYSAWMLTDNATIVSASAAGQGPLPATSLALNADRTQDLHFPAVDNLVRNGNFESANLAAWTASGSLPVIPAAGYSGAQGLLLGSDCAPLCNAPAEPVLVGYQSQIAIGTDGVLHALILNTQDGLSYTSRSTLGLWSPPEKLADAANIFILPSPELSLDAQGNLYAFWTNNTPGLSYRIKPQGQAWGPEHTVAGDRIVDQVVDPAGGIHILKIDFDKVYYLEIPPNGPALSPVLVDQVQYRIANASLALGPDGSLEFAWTFYGGLSVRSRQADKSWAETEKLDESAGTPEHPLSLGIDSLNQVHLMYVNASEKTCYLVRTQDGSWTNPIVLDSVNSQAIMLSGQQGVFHLFDGFDTPSRYYQLTPGRGWSGPRQPGFNLSDAAIDSQDNLHFMASTSGSGDSMLSYLAPARVEADGEAVITQTVTLPTGLHSPTLAFLSRMQGGQPRTTTYFEVTVTDELTTTQVFRAAQNYPWQHRWVDLQTFAGKTVTLGFHLHQAAGEPPVQVNVDDVSIGSWMTPVVKSVTPWRIQALQDLTITGENFLATPQVWIGAVQIPDGDVSWIDSAHLKVHLKVSLRSGVHDIKIINPGGAEGVLLGALKTGWELFLPGLFR